MNAMLSMRIPMPSMLAPSGDVEEQSRAWP